MMSCPLLTQSGSRAANFVCRTTIDTDAEPLAEMFKLGRLAKDSGRKAPSGDRQVSPLALPARPDGRSPRTDFPFRGDRSASHKVLHKYHLGQLSSANVA